MVASISYKKTTLKCVRKTQIQLDKKQGRKTNAYKE